MNFRHRAREQRKDRPGWTFHIVEHLPTATNDKLIEREAAVLKRVIERGGCVIHNKHIISRNDKFIELAAFGKKQSIAAWEKETRTRRNTIYGRLGAGWPVESALTEPSRCNDWLRRNHKNMRAQRLSEMSTKILDDNGDLLLVIEAAERLGVNKESFQDRLRIMRNMDGLMEITMEQLRNMRWRNRKPP